MSKYLIGFIFFCVALNAHAATLKIATLSPDGSSLMKLLRQHAKIISERTDGQVKFKFYPGGVMGDDKAVVRKMRVGQLHGAVITAGGLVQKYPDIALYNLPMLFRNEAEVDHVRANLDAQLMAGLLGERYIGFGFAEVGFAYPMSQHKATAVKDVRSRRVWVPDNDPGSLRAFQAFKIAPIPLPIADVLAGLQTGLIDSIASPPIGAIVLQWHTQVEYVLDLPLMYVYGLFTMAQRPFDKLSAQQQQVVRQELSAAVRLVDRSARADHNSAKAALTNQGLAWLSPSKAEMDEWQNLANVASEKMVADGFISADLYRQTLELLAQFRAANR